MADAAESASAAIVSGDTNKSSAGVSKAKSKRKGTPDPKVVDPQARPYRAETDYLLKEQIGRFDHDHN
jgi:hypothetical protein